MSQQKTDQSERERKQKSIAEAFNPDWNPSAAMDHATDISEHETSDKRADQETDPVHLRWVDEWIRQREHTQKPDSDSQQGEGSACKYRIGSPQSHTEAAKGTRYECNDFAKKQLAQRFTEHFKDRTEYCQQKIFH